MWKRLKSMYHKKVSVFNRITFWRWFFDIFSKQCLLLKTDYKVGFGGVNGLQKDRMDKSSVGWDHVEKVDKHSSQIGKDEILEVIVEYTNHARTVFENRLKCLVWIYQPKNISFLLPWLFEFLRLKNYLMLIFQHCYNFLGNKDENWTKICTKFMYISVLKMTFFSTEH